MYNFLKWKKELVIVICPSAAVTSHWVLPYTMWLGFVVWVPWRAMMQHLSIRNESSILIQVIIKEYMELLFLRKSGRKMLNYGSSDWIATTGVIHHKTHEDIETIDRLTMIESSRYACIDIWNISLRLPSGWTFTLPHAPYHHNIAI